MYTLSLSALSMSEKLSNLNIMYVCKYLYLLGSENEVYISNGC